MISGPTLLLDMFLDTTAGTAPPVVTSVAPLRGAVHGTKDVVLKACTLSGTAFDPSGMTVGFSGSGVTAENVTFTSTTVITLDIRIAAAAATGTRILTFTDSGGSSTTAFIVELPTKRSRRL